MEGEWIEWAGGECPVDGHRRVEVRLRDGSIVMLDADSFDFVYSPDDAETDIVAHRVIA